MKWKEELSSQLWTQFMQLRKKPEKIQDQPSYEANDVGSWSIMCSYVPVKEMNVTNAYENEEWFFIWFDSLN